MKLQIESVEIEDVRTAPETCASGNVLHLNVGELKEILLRDERIGSVNLHVVHPGSGVRIVNVVDVIQPRCKIDSDHESFPGWLGKLKVAGEGRTRSLQDVGVIITNRYSNRNYSSIVDMFGVGAEIGRYGRMKNVCVDPCPGENVDERDFESAVKLAGLKTAVYLARSAEGIQPSRTEVYELDLAKLRCAEQSGLPRIAYYYQLYTPQHDYQGMSDPVLYGTEVTHLLPTLIHPNEILDGAVLSPHTMRNVDTYSIQNHAVIKELYERHGKDLIFVGVVIGVASLEPIQRQRMAIMAGNMVSNMLGADGVILTKTHGGMPHVDLAFVAESCETMGVKTVLFIQLVHSDGSTADEALFSSDHLNAVVNIGQTQERIRLQQADLILGGDTDTLISNPDFVQKAGDKEIEVESFLVAGVYDILGGSRIKAVDY